MLQLLALGIPDVLNFDFMSKPSPGKSNMLHMLLAYWREVMHEGALWSTVAMFFTFVAPYYTESVV